MADQDGENERDRIASLERRTAEILQSQKLGQERLNALQEVVARQADDGRERVAAIEQRLKIQQERMNTLQEVVARLASTISASSVTAYISEMPLTNDDVIQLGKLALGDEVVLAKIKQAPAAAFNLASDDLGKLKTAGVSAQVIAAMLEKATPSTPAAACAVQPGPDATGAGAQVELVVYSPGCADQVGAVLKLGSSGENGSSFKVDKGWEGVDVTLTRYGGAQLAGGGLSTVRARTDANGQFAFPVLEAGDYILTTTPPKEPARIQGKKGLNAVNVKLARVSVDGAANGPITFGWDVEARATVPVLTKSDGKHPLMGRTIIKSKSNIANN